MLKNHSPWIKQLQRQRQAEKLQSDKVTDVAVVGGGIAGVVSAFFTLKNTDKSVIVLEADKIAHGATGHNAGQITSYFERPLYDIAGEFGVEMATSGQKDVENAWDLIEEIVQEMDMQTPFYKFLGHAGLTSEKQIFSHLKNSAVRDKGGLPKERIWVAEEWEGIYWLPERYEDFFATVPQKQILEALETSNTEYIACLSYQKGCMNSALFTEELLQKIQAKYSDRFSFYEESPMQKLILKKDGGCLLEINGNSLSARKTVLCTNGFENFEIINEKGEEINTKFHHTVGGRIGYMAGYTDTQIDQPTSISYFPKSRLAEKDLTGESYFYLTRRPYGKEEAVLVCVGGPEKSVDNTTTYIKESEYEENIDDELRDFLKTTYDKYSKKSEGEIFHWHGLMGYTPNGIRRVGFEPKNPDLLYNLGCNGVGILPSIFGGWKIAGFLQGKTFPPSIFDPQ